LAPIFHDLAERLVRRSLVVVLSDLFDDVPDILAGLRHLSQAVERETRNMPIDLDIRDHEVLGPMFIEAEQKGRQEGELTVLRRLIEKRFGPLPGWAGQKLAALPVAELEDLSERVLDAKSVEELLR